MNETSSQGQLIWVTGLAGSGKSTIAKLLSDQLRAKGQAIVYLDGDILRETLGGGYGHDIDTRRMLAAKYSRICKMLVDQGVHVVAAFIAMMHDIHAWNREHIEDYVEVFVDVPMEELIRRDQKGLYSKALAGEITDVVGIDQAAEFPLNPSLVLDNHGDKSAEESVAEIMRHLGY